MRSILSESKKNASLSLGIVLCVLLVGGCGDRTVEVKPEAGGILPPANPESIAVEEEKPQVATAGKQPWLAPQKALPTTSWYSQYHNGKCIGISEFTITSSETQGASLLRLTKRDILEIAANASTPMQRREIFLESLELPEGEFKSYTETSKIGDSVSVSSAALLKNTLTTTKTVDGKPSPPVSLEWTAGTWGPLGTIAILRQKPMEANEYRVASIFVPPINKIVAVEFKSKNWELTTLPGGIVKDLLLVETLFVNDEGKSLTKNWVDKDGEIVKSVSPGGFTMFQITRDEAKRIDASMLVAQLLGTTIPINVSASQLEKPRVTFSIDSKNLELFELLSHNVNQQVKSLSTLGAEVTVYRALPTDDVPEGAGQEPPDASVRQKFSQGAAPLKSFLRELQLDATDQLEIAQKLTDGLYRRIKKMELSRTSATLPQVLEKRAGDCNAHALLLVAALRERDIPARGANGLRIVQNTRNGEIIAIYHMWCEAWIGDRWLPLDPFTGSVGVGVDHIKFFESSLNEDNSLAIMLNVLKPMSQLTIVVKP